MLQTFRLLLPGRPGQGKTHLGQRLIFSWPGPMVVSDPLDEYDVPERAKKIKGFTKSSLGEIVEAGTELPEGGLLLVDEAHRVIENEDRIDTNILLELLDISRNFGLSWVVMTKQATMLPTLVSTLANWIAYKPSRTPAVRDWYRRAGLDPDVPPLEAPLAVPSGNWYVAHESEEVPRVMSEEEILALAERSVTLKR